MCRVTHQKIYSLFDFNKNTNEFRSKDGKCVATKIDDKFVLLGITGDGVNTGEYVDYGEYKSLRDAVRFYVDNVWKR